MPLNAERRLRQGFLLAAFLLSVTVRAELQPGVRLRLSQASASFAQLEYESALNEVFAAKRLARSSEELVQVGLFEGIILIALSRIDEAHSAFEAALLRAPSAQLPLSVSPKISTEFARVRTQVRGELAARRALTPPASPRHSRVTAADRSAPPDDSGPPPPPDAPFVPTSPAPVASSPALPPPVALRPGRSYRRGVGFSFAGLSVAAAGTGATLFYLSKRYDSTKQGLTFDAANHRRVTAVNELGAAVGCGAVALVSGAAALVFLLPWHGGGHVAWVPLATPGSLLLAAEGTF